MERPAAPPAVRGDFATSRPWVSRGLGIAGFLSITTPFAAALALRALGLYGESVRAHLSVIGPTLIVVVGPLLFLLGRLAARVRLAPGALRLEGEVLALETSGGTSRIPLAQVVEGARETSSGDGFRLKLADGRTLVAGFLGAPAAGCMDAREFLSALGLDAARRVATLRASAIETPAYRAAWMFVSMVVLTFVAGDAIPKPYRALCIVLESLFAWWLATAAIGPAVTVGVDGMRVRGAGRSAFYPWSEVRGVAESRGALQATLASGRAVHLGSTRDPRAQALRERIDEARAAAGGDARRDAATARSGRPVAEWRAAMAGLLAGAGYRSGSVTADDLDDVMRNGTATAEQRAGAAMALMASDPERHATRVRIAAEALAEEPARRALEEIAEGEVAEAVLERTARRS